MSRPQAVAPLTRRQRHDLAALGLRTPSLAPLDTGWGPRVGLHIVTDGDRRVVLKRLEPGRGSIVERSVKRRSIRREVATYGALEHGRWTHLRHPRLLATDGRTYLVLSHVAPAPRWPPDLGARAVQALFELHVGLAGAWRGGPAELLRQRAAWRVLVRAGIGELRRGNRSSYARILRLVARAYVAIVRAGSPRLAQHGDATFGNVIVGADGGISWIDFERLTTGELLSFRDAVQLAANPALEGGFDPAILRDYTRLWCRTLSRPPAEAEHHLRLALLLHVLHVLHVYPARADVRAIYQRFLDELLRDAAFRAWIQMHEILPDVSNDTGFP